MPTLNEIVFLLAEKLPKPDGVPSEVTLEMLKFTVGYWRQQFLRRDYADNLRFPQAAIDELLLDTELISAVSHVENAKQVRRTKQVVPLPVRYKNWQEFIYVGTEDNKTPFTAVLPEEVEFRLANKRSGNTPCFYLRAERLYLFNTSIQKVFIRYVIADPRHAVCDSYDDDSAYKIPGDMLDGIVQGILSGELRTLTPPPSATTEITL
jgi:hypothetical protein